MTQVNGKFYEEHHVNFGTDKESLLPSNCASEWRSLRLPYQEMRPHMSHMHSIAKIAKKYLPLNKRLAPQALQEGSYQCHVHLSRCTNAHGKHAKSIKVTPLQDDTLPNSPVVSKHEEVTAGHHIGVSSRS